MVLSTKLRIVRDCATFLRPLPLPLPLPLMSLSNDYSTTNKNVIYIFIARIVTNAVIQGRPICRKVSEPSRNSNGVKNRKVKKENVHVLYKTLDLVFSRCHLAEEERTETRCAKVRNARAQRLLFLVKTICVP